MRISFGRCLPECVSGLANFQGPARWVFRQDFAAAFIAAVFVLAFGSNAAFGAEWSAETHTLSVGDFNDDGWDDLLVLARDADRYSGIALRENVGGSSAPTNVVQTWASDYLGIQWHSDQYTPLVGSFGYPKTVSTCSGYLNYWYEDIVLQNNGPGSHHVLLADSAVGVDDIDRSFTDPNLGQIWDTNSHRGIVGHFTVGAGGDVNDSLHDIFLQPVSSSGESAVVVGSTATVYEDPSQVTDTWTGTHATFDWSTEDAVVHAGDFDGDGLDDLLVQGTTPGGPTDDGQYGIVRATSTLSTEVQFDSVFMNWSRHDGGIDWSPDTHVLHVGDFDDNGFADIFLQPINSGEPAYIVMFDGSGTTAGWTISWLEANQNGIDWSVNGGKLLIGNFAGPQHGAADIYYQAAAAGGSNRIAQLTTIPNGAAATVAVTSPLVEPSLDPPPPSQAYTPGTAVGHTPGEFSVDHTGVATYQIPIAVPPGVSGMEPGLGLAYSSRGGNGLLGMGWYISGLSTIGRCGTTIAQDGGTPDGVDLDDNDQFCMDGQRLMNLSGSEYRTEVESFQKIVASGTSGNGPETFVVWDKSGNIRTYGKYAGADDGLITAQGTDNPLVYAVKRIQDRYGNQITFQYGKDEATSTYWPAQVDYGSSTSNVASVVFQYETADREDLRHGYLAGSVVGLAARRLSSIQTFAAGQPVREYFLEHDYSAISGRSLLQSVTECERTTNKCLESTSFDWQEGSRGFTNGVDQYNVGDPTWQFLRRLDVNNDARLDVAYMDPQDSVWIVKTYREQGAPTIPVVEHLVHGAEFVQLDFNGDGYHDLIQRNQESTAPVPLEILAGFDAGNGHAGFDKISTNVWMTAPALLDGIGADVNGDGRDDLVWQEDEKIKANLSDGTSLEQVAITGDMPDIGSQLDHSFFAKLDGVVWHPIHFDNDNIIDLLACRTDISYDNEGLPSAWVTQLEIYSFDPATPSLAYKHTPGNCDDIFGIQTIDTNGDGLTDLLLRRADAWELYINKGGTYEQTWSRTLDQNYTYKTVDDSDPDALVRLDWDSVSATVTFPFNAERADAAMPLDYDGDGRTDMAFQRAIGQWHVLISDGEGFGGVVKTGKTATHVYPGQIVDVGGDGFPDIIHPNAALTAYLVFHQRGIAKDLLDTVTDGLGAMTKIAYTSLNDPEVYEDHDDTLDGQTDSQAFPYADLGSTLPVVKKFAVDDGIGGVIETMYRYKGAKVHRQGYGFVGFSEIQSWNTNSEIFTISGYMQEWPFIGNVHLARIAAKVEVELASPLPFSATVYAGLCDLDPGSVYCLQDPLSNTLVQFQPGDTISETTNQFTTTADPPTAVSTFPYVMTSTEKVYPLSTNPLVDNSVPWRIKTATYEHYDDYGNPWQVTVTNTDGSGGNVHSTVTKNYFTNDAANWIIGRLETTVVTHTRTPYEDTVTANSLTRVSSFSYHATTGILLEETVEPLNYMNPNPATHSATSATNPTGKWLKTVYSYDAVGNIETETVTGRQIPARTTTTTYDSAKQFPRTIQNALQHQETHYWDHKFGVRTALIGANNLETSWAYDNFGRVIRETLPQTGAGSSYFYNWCNGAGCVDGDAVYSVTTIRDDGARATAEHDKLGRTVLEKSRSFNGSDVFVTHVFDPLGREYLTSLPYRSSETPCWNIKKFDAVNRVVAQWESAPSTDPLNPSTCNVSENTIGYNDVNFPPGGRTVTTVYDQITDAGHVAGAGHIETTTTAYGRTTNSVVNVMDRVRVVHELGEVYGQSGTQQLVSTYDYDAVGNNTWVKDAEGNITKITYDSRGQKTTMNDPNTGVWAYEYDALGQLTLQADGNGATTYQKYDLLGRLTLRRDNYEQTTCSGLWRRTDWVYDNGPGAGIGKLAEAIGPYSEKNGAPLGPINYREKYHYDSYGRLEHLVRTIDGEEFWTSQAHDTLGRTQQLSYPATSGDATSTFAGSDRYSVEYAYSANSGELLKVEESATGKLHWVVTARNAAGQATQTHVNHGGIDISRTFDRATGRMLQTAATSSQAAFGDVQYLQYQWDAAGNLTQRIDHAFTSTTLEESFTYDSIYRLKTSTVTAPVTGGNPVVYTNHYSATGRIMARVSPGVNVSSYQYGVNAGPHAVTQVNNGGSTQSYSYDNNGNLLTGAGRTVIWNGHNKPTSITDTNGNLSEFRYGPDRGRFSHVQDYDDNGTPESVTTLYLGAEFEQISKDSTTAVEFRHYIFAEGRRIAIHTEWDNGNSRDDYLHSDYLGSVTAITDGNNLIVQRLSYDPWGKRRDPQSWDAAGSVSPPFLDTLSLDWFARGFTDHEHLDRLGLIHMNGRIYDPLIGRFLSADVVVQFPYSTQGWDRYAYVGNNPLSYSDPSGHFITAIVGIVAYAIGGKVAAAVAVGITAAIVAYKETGNLGYALTSGFIAGVTSYALASMGPVSFRSPVLLVAKSTTAGLMSGVANAASGGEFKDGFLGGFAGTALSPWIGGKPGKFSHRSLLKTALVGGTASKLGGGKFANGAAYAAFAAAVASGAQAARDSRLSQDVNEHFQHFDGDLHSQTSSEFPAATKRALGEVLDSPIGDQLRADVAANGKIDVILTDNSDLWFYTDDVGRQIFYTTDLTSYIATGTRIPGDGLNSATLGTQFAHEIGHVLKPLTVGGFNASRINEIQTVQKYENVFRQYKQLPRRCSYFAENDAC